jgi:hypothetical protein
LLCLARGAFLPLQFIGLPHCKGISSSWAVSMVHLLNVRTFAAYMLHWAHYRRCGLDVSESCRVSRNTDQYIRRRVSEAITIASDLDSSDSPRVMSSS